MTTVTNPWILGARPRTLPAAVVPVAVGAAAAALALEDRLGDLRWWAVVLALVVSVALQVGVNYANDYSDGVRGTDDRRVGPTRLVAAGLASPAAVRRAAFLAFGAAALAGSVLAATTSWWLIVVGLVAIAAAWGYTGGPKPYGYLGLGELFVFVFFGLVATAGTTYVAAEEITLRSIVLGAAVGALACALLVVNNLRDLETDRAVGKATLVVRLGDRTTRLMYAGLIVAALVLVVVSAIGAGWLLLGLIAAPVAIGPVRRVLGGAVGAELIEVLGATGRVQSVLGAGVCAGALVIALG